MVELVDPEVIELKLGCDRHVTNHIARAVDEESTVYIMHSKVCLSKHEDLRDCAFSVVQEAGIDSDEPWSHWRSLTDTTVVGRIGNGYLLPHRTVTTWFTEIEGFVQSLLVGFTYGRSLDDAVRVFNQTVAEVAEMVDIEEDTLVYLMDLGESGYWNDEEAALARQVAHKLRDL